MRIAGMGLLLVGFMGCSGRTVTAQATDGATETSPSTSGNTTHDTGGSSTGPSPVCGNGIVEGDEMCDDGNANPCDGCDVACKPTGGQEAWVRSLDGADGLDDELVGTTVLANGNVVVSGVQTVTGEGRNAFLEARDPNGNQVWTVVEDLGASVGTGVDDLLGRVAADPNGGFVAAGIVFQEGNNSGVTGRIARYAADGTTTWDLGVTEGSSVALVDVALDDAGNVVAVGSVSGNDQDGFAIAVDPDGNEIWRQTVGQPGGDDLLLGVAFDGSAIIAGGRHGVDEVNAQAWRIAFDGSGTPLWDLTYRAVGPRNQVAGVTAAGGRIFLVGQNWEASQDLWAGEIDGDGDAVWYWTREGGNDGTDSLIAVAARGDRLYLVGAIDGPNGHQEAYLLATTLSGEPVWATTHTSNGDAYAWDVTVDEAGAIYVAGGEVVSGEQWNGWVGKYCP